MRFGKVVGKLVLSQSDASLRGARWLVVCPLSRADFLELNRLFPLQSGPSCVVYDELGADVGDMIGFTEGGEAMLPFDSPVPVDAYNAIIVDRVHLGKAE